eukprot:TRINITY_DN103941_c0_g1_i1.p1 TRINITY_DN103941_c0_g1~~TRINITY_DN103941_c0_g1_i1.p1  ORF type:complete len:661 (-),score=82.79 TRINITY_DN103941_c0_g1_i1:126-2108(-)
MKSFLKVLKGCFASAISACMLPGIPCDGLEEPSQRVKILAHKEFERHNLRKTCWYLKFACALLFMAFVRFSVDFLRSEDGPRHGHEFNVATSVCLLIMFTSVWAFLRREAAQELKMVSRILRVASYLAAFVCLALQDEHISWASRQTPLAYARNEYYDNSQYPYCDALPLWSIDHDIQFQLVACTFFFVGNLMSLREALPAVCLAVSAYITATHLSRTSWREACASSFDWVLLKDNLTYRTDLAGLVTLYSYAIVPLIIYKAINENFMTFVFVLLEQQKRSFISERVLRYEAEHSAEAMAATTATSCPQELTDDCSMDRSYVTARSSPARFCNIMKPFTQGVDVDICDGADCLPSNYLAQVEGVVGPQSLDTLRANQKVLCHDNLRGSTVYVEVVECNIRSAAPDVSWLNVSFSDGTSLIMTADHPLQAKFDQCLRPISASHLVPGKHSILSVRLVDLEVVAVTELETVSAHAISPVELLVRQGERYSPMVFPPGAGAFMVSASALGSADLSVIPTSRSHKEAYPLVRSNSSPAKICTRLVKDTSMEPADTSDATTSSGGNIDHIEIMVQSSADSARLGKVDDDVVTLSDIQAMRQVGLKSLGGKVHSTGMCRPCSFFNCKTKEQFCKMGILCRMCHEQHGQLSRRELRNLARETKHQSL